MKRTKRLITVSFLAAISVAMLSSSPAWAGPSRADKCEAAKLKEASKLGKCRLAAEAKSVKKGTAPDFSKCGQKFSDKWQRAETKAAGACPTNGDEAAVAAEITSHTNSVGATLAGTAGQEKCAAAKLKEAAKYGACRLSAGSIGIKKGVPADFGKCDIKFSGKWQRIESKLSPNCPTTGDGATMQSTITAHTDLIAHVISGTVACGDGFVDTGEECDGADDAACPGGCQADCTCEIRQVTVQLGASNVEDGLTQVGEGGDGVTNATTVAGRECREMVLNGFGGRYMYFDVSGDFVFATETAVVISVEYNAQTSGWLAIDYDSSDPGAPGGGAFKSTATVFPSGDGAWKTEHFVLSDAFFGNRQGISDFRISRNDDDAFQLCIARVTVTKEECGDGIVTPGEECDDGNTIDGDGCDSNCNTEQTSVAVDLGVTNVENGLAQVGEGGDGTTSPTTVAGRECREMVFNGTGARYMYFDVDDSFIFATETAVAVTVEYNAGTRGIVRLEYDSTDTRAPAGGIFTPGGNAAEPGDGQWKTASFYLPNAYFANRMGGDFRVSRNDSDSFPLCISRVTVDLVMCGDGKIVAGEDCEDGNTVDGDGCDSNCLFTRCGNGIVTSGEECDDGDYSPTCDRDCTLPVCGDGVFNPRAGEGCDDGNTMGSDGCEPDCTHTPCIQAGAPTCSGTCSDGFECAVAASGADCECVLMKVGTFYYPWYGNPETDRYWVHWEAASSVVSFVPPSDLSADYYPTLGAYSSNDPDVIDQHLQWMEEAGIHLLISSWWGEDTYEDQALPLLLERASGSNVKVTAQIAPYAGRSDASVVSDIDYIYQRYGSEPAFFRTPLTSINNPSTEPKPLFFVWAADEPDFGQGVVTADYWLSALDQIHASQNGSLVLANIFDGSWVNDGHFDGVYNYANVFLTSDFFANYAASIPAGGWYVPSVIPGFEVERQQRTVTLFYPRADGGVYDFQWSEALGTGVEPQLVTVTSFNEWHEGTQIEPAADNVENGFGYTYRSYAPLDPSYYIERTRQWKDIFVDMTR